jgi:hypothetical protein
MKNLSSAVGIFALALGALATQSCEYADNPYGHYGRHPYDDYPRYAQDHYYSEGGYGRPDAYGRQGSYDQDEYRQRSIVIPLPGY